MEKTTKQLEFHDGNMMQQHDGKTMQTTQWRGTHYIEQIT
jgi:hypothetical protein